MNLSIAESEALIHHLGMRLESEKRQLSYKETSNEQRKDAGLAPYHVGDLEILKEDIKNLDSVLAKAKEHNDMMRGVAVTPKRK